MPPVQLGKKPIYSGAWDCAVKTVKKEGFFGLYKGIMNTLTIIIINFVSNAFSFSMFLFCFMFLNHLSCHVQNGLFRSESLY